MVSLSANWAYICITMVWKKQSTVKNTGAPLPTGKKDVSVDIPAPIQNKAETYISSKRTTPGFLTYRQGTVRNGNWDTTNEPLSNGQINAKR